MRTVAALSWLLLLLPVRAGATDWVRVETANLVVYGPGEKRTREVTAEFERFREAISQVLPGQTATSPVPTIIVAFENQVAFNPYLPTFNGKPVKLAGFYAGTETDNMIAFAQDNRENGLRIIFHEYTHLITANASRGLPAWVNEGIADFYSTFEIRPDGKQALLGRVVPGHIELLNSMNRWLTLEQLLTVTHDSPLYNEGERRSIFYAQSWAMVHLIMTGQPRRSKELGQYVQLTADGMAPLDAWKRAFGDFDVLKELRRYVTQFTVQGFLYKFAEGVGPVKAESSKPNAAEVEAVLSRLRRFRGGDQIDPQLAKAASMTPPSMLARALLGHTLSRTTQDHDGIRYLVEAASDTSDWLTQYYVASAVVGMGGDPSEEVVAIARAAVDRVIAARPQLAHAHALKTHFTPNAEGLAHIRKARALAPGREDYVFLEARLHAELRDFPAARNTLSVLLTPRYSAHVRERARVLMGQIVRYEEVQGKRIGAPPPTTTTPPTLRSRDDYNAFRPTATEWILRELKPGEQRLEGTLEQIDCTRTGTVTLLVRADGIVKRFVAPQFGDIEFITYREQQGGSIPCGERKPADRIYVTWLALETPTEGVTGRPVAVEFLPDR
jgi:uncharacterized protein DUF1570